MKGQQKAMFTVIKHIYTSMTHNCLCRSTSTYLLCYQLKGHRELPNFCVGEVGRKRSFVQREWISVKHAREECEKPFKVAQKILLWKSYPTSHLIFLQNNFCGNAAYHRMGRRERKINNSNFGSCNDSPGAKAGIHVVLNLQSNKLFWAASLLFLVSPVNCSTIKLK